MADKKPETVTISFRVPVEVRDKVDAIANKWRRSRAVQAEIFFTQGLEEYEQRKEKPY